MALIHCDFFSETIGMSSAMDVILPEQTSERQIGMAGSEKRTSYPCLLLLHGLSDDHTIWQRRTSIERYTAELGLAVVMPNVHRSFYTNMKYGYRYWDYICEELPAKARLFFPLSEKREDNFTAGLSMGGYGAFKLALKCPDRFCAAASLSGSLHMSERIKDRERLEADARLVFGTADIAGTEHDLLTCAEKFAASGGKMPILYQCCGTEDFLYEDNIRFRDHALKLGFDLTYEEGPGEHEWGYWDRMIQRVLAWLPVRQESGN